MATSSIMKNFVISDSKKVEAFADVLDECAKSYIPQKSISARQLTDSKEIKDLMMKAKRNKTNE